MARDKKADDWLDAHGIEKPVHIVTQIGFIGSRSKRGATVGVLLRYRETDSSPVQEMRFHLPAETARQVAAELQSYADLAEHQMPDPTPTKPN